MITLYAITMAISSVFLHSAIASSENVVHPKLPITSDWLHLEGMDNQQFKVFRKYTFVPEDKETPIRNVLMLNCALDEPSYLNFIIPKQLPLKDLYGQENIEKQLFHVVVSSLSDAKERIFNLEGEVKGNHIFFDFVGDQRKAISTLLTADKFTLFFDDFRRLEFVEMNDPSVFPNLGDGQSFDQFVSSMISNQYKIDEKPSVGQMLKSCPDIEAWNSLLD